MSETTHHRGGEHQDQVRRGSGAPLAEVSGIDSAAASGTTPRAPAQDTTAGTGHDGAGRRHAAG